MYIARKIGWNEFANRGYSHPVSAFREYGHAIMVDIIGIGAFVGIFDFLQAGFERMLSFLPENFGFYEEDMDFTSTKQWLSFIIAFNLSLIFAQNSPSWLKKDKKKDERRAFFDFGL